MLGNMQEPEQKMTKPPSVFEKQNVAKNRGKQKNGTSKKAALE